MPVTPNSEQSQNSPDLPLEGTVIAIVHEFKQAWVATKNGRRFAITTKTPGINLAALKEGQRVRFKVEGILPRIVFATLIE